MEDRDQGYRETVRTGHSVLRTEQRLSLLARPSGSGTMTPLWALGSDATVCDGEAR